MATQGSVDLSTLKQGTPVLGTDSEIGTLERVDAGGQQLIVRRGHAADLLAVPASNVSEASVSGIKLTCSREDAERMVLRDGATLETTKATPSPDDVLGKQNVDTQIDGPSTG